MEIDGLSTFGKTQIDEFKASVAEFKQKKQQEVIDEVVDWIRGRVLSSAVKGKNVLFLNIVALVDNYKFKDPEFPVPGLSRNGRGRREGNITVYLDLDYIKSAVLTLVLETFTIPAIVLKTETLTEIRDYWDVIEHAKEGVIKDIHDDEYGIVERKHKVAWSREIKTYKCIVPVGSEERYYDEDDKRSELVHHEKCLWGDNDIRKMSFVIELDGTIHCKGCYLYKLLFAEEIDSDNVPDEFFFINPIEHLRVVIKIPK